jgi:mannose-6-phosphate isomerase
MNNYYTEIEYTIRSLGFTIESKDFERPWGGFLVINENQAQEFSDEFFMGLDVNKLKIAGKLSPKILIVEPGSRLSWQYHDRRAEIWQVFRGSVGIVKSVTDVENEMRLYNKGEQIVLEQGERHRLIGLDDFAVVAEIWRHTDVHRPSDEDDIIRVQDDFGR